MSGKKTKETKEKPLEEMTSKELRDIVLTFPNIQGVHGMNKGEMIVEIKKAKGIPIEARKKSNALVRDVKKKMKELKVRQATALKDENAKLVEILKHRIARLKKKTRKAA